MGSAQATLQQSLSRRAPALTSNNGLLAHGFQNLFGTNDVVGPGYLVLLSESDFGPDLTLFVSPAGRRPCRGIGCNDGESGFAWFGKPGLRLICSFSWESLNWVEIVGGLSKISCG
jgi:hypothetical protein